MFYLIGGFLILIIGILLRVRIQKELEDIIEMICFEKTTNLRLPISEVSKEKIKSGLIQILLVGLFTGGILTGALLDIIIKLILKN